MLASSLLGAVHGVCPVNVVCRPGFGCKLASTRYHLQRRQCRNLRQQDRHEAVITAAASASTQTGALQLSQNLPDSREQAVRLATAPQHTEAWPSKNYTNLQIKQASDAVGAQLDASGGSKSKGFKTSSVKKLIVDIPVADQTAPAVRMLHT